jgi:hypothetical protein
MVDGLWCATLPLLDRAGPLDFVRSVSRCGRRSLP